MSSSQFLHFICFQFVIAIPVHGRMNTRTANNYLGGDAESERSSDSNDTVIDLFDDMKLEHQQDQPSNVMPTRRRLVPVTRHATYTRTSAISPRNTLASSLLSNPVTVTTGMSNREGMTIVAAGHQLLETGPIERISPPLPTITPINEREPQCTPDSKGETKIPVHVMMVSGDNNLTYVGIQSTSMTFPENIFHNGHAREQLLQRQLSRVLRVPLHELQGSVPAHVLLTDSAGKQNDKGLYSFPTFDNIARLQGMYCVRAGVHTCPSLECHDH